MSPVGALSGFPEWLPGQRIVEQHVHRRLREVFELHGFGSVQTRAVEPLDQLTRKGDIAQEVYVLRRLHAGDDEPDRGLGLHFDLTVPFARYVLQNAGHLQFPFRRYQIQPAWRGERPQEGRYREFWQADIDVVDRDSLAFHYDVEVAVVVGEALAALPIPPVTIQVNNRKLAEGFFRGVGAADPAAALRAVDKLDKIGSAGVQALLESTAGLTEAGARRCLDLASIRTPDLSFVDQVRALGVADPMLEDGLAELVAVMEGAGRVAPGLVVADLRVARGLDYYTGTVFETQLCGHEDLGSICSGGRYDTLASEGARRYPGVGVSIGVSRILGRLFGRGLVGPSRSVPTCVLVAVADESARSESDRVATALRARGIPTEVAPTAAKYGQQIKHADRRGIPFVWFPVDSSVRDIRSGSQVTADPASWRPPDTDLHPSVVRLDDPGPDPQGRPGDPRRPEQQT